MAIGEIFNATINATLRAISEKRAVVVSADVDGPKRGARTFNAYGIARREIGRVKNISALQVTG